MVRPKTQALYPQVPLPVSPLRRLALVKWSGAVEQIEGTRLDDDRRAPGVITMRIVCAWCSREGQPGYLGEREPLDNQETTHGICRHHTAQLLESLPAPSFPDAEVLIVVHRNDMLIFENLTRSFAAMSRVKVIVDRRVSERRAASGEGSDERRHLKTRRIREGAVSPLGDFTILWFTPRAKIRVTAEWPARPQAQQADIAR
jgi:hypothetical protein